MDFTYVVLLVLLYLILGSCILFLITALLKSPRAKSRLGEFKVNSAIGRKLIKSPRAKGRLGELKVNSAIWMNLDKNKYPFIENVTLPTENGTTQIDHIIVSKYGIFVVETKNMRGWIFGSQNQKTWTQATYRDKNKFQNPLHQNYGHIKALESLLDMEEKQFFSVVVFVDSRVRFKTKMPDNVTCTIDGCIRFIKSKVQEIFTELEVKEIVNKIESDRLTPSIKTDRAHVEHVKTMRSKMSGKKKTEAGGGVKPAEKKKQNNQSCPKCGKEMLMREVKSGKNIGNKFWGCSTFPKCWERVNVT